MGSGEEAFVQYWSNVGQRWLSTAYALVTAHIVLSLCLLLKFVYTSFYFFKNVKDKFLVSRERMKEKQMVEENIQLQLQLVDTKILWLRGESEERVARLGRAVGALREGAARARGLAAAEPDPALRRAAAAAADHTHEERDSIMALLKELKAYQVAIPEAQTDMMECGELAVPDNSVYSSLSDDADAKDYQVKIVTVHKVVYLKQYYKQKRLRRATKQALLKKKIEDTKKLFEDWQKALSMVINSSRSMLDANPFDVASQEAMGDYSKPNLRDSSDCDSDLRASGADSDDYSLSWAQNPYIMSYPYSYDDIPETTVAKELYDSQELTEVNDQVNSTQICEGSGTKGHALFILPEETSSQIAIEETKSDSGSSGTQSRDVS